MRNNSFAKKSRAASHLAGDECSPGCGHMGLQLLDPPEKPESWDVRGDTTLLDFQAKFPMAKKISSKNKKFRHAKPNNHHHHHNEVVSPDNYIFQDQTYCTGTQNMFPAGLPKLSFLSGNSTFFVDCCCWFPTKVNACLYTAAALFSWPLITVR